MWVGERASERASEDFRGIVWAQDDENADDPGRDCHLASNNRHVYTKARGKGR